MTLFVAAHERNSSQPVNRKADDSDKAMGKASTRGGRQGPLPEVGTFISAKMQQSHIHDRASAEDFGCGCLWTRQNRAIRGSQVSGAPTKPLKG
jgi:hypothetical protein